MSTTERAAAIRQTLKSQHGWTSKDVSVRSSSFANGSSIQISIKNPDVNIATVQAVAGQHESISRCELTGEILSGGNRYIHVSYTHEAAEQLTERMIGPVSTAAAELATAGENSLIPVPGTAYLLGRGRWGQGFSVWTAGPTGSHKAEAYDLRQTALVIAIDGWSNAAPGGHRRK